MSGRHFGIEIRSALYGVIKVTGALCFPVSLAFHIEVKTVTVLVQANAWGGISDLRECWENCWMIFPDVFSPECLHLFLSLCLTAALLLLEPRQNVSLQRVRMSKVIHRLLVRHNKSCMLR